MKKFSWIFALVLALSIGFVGCPAGDDGDDTPPPPPWSYTKNADAEDFTVNFASGGTGTISAGVATTAIKKTGDNNGPIDPGTLTYITDGYRYAYGSGSNTNYGNVIHRFRINLGEFCLADYGKITFDWQAEAPLYADTNTVNSGKNLWLFATDDEDKITPYQDGKADLVVSTRLFDDTPAANYYGIDNNKYKVPSVEGLDVHHVEMPIIAKKETVDLEGAVWLAIYVHAEGGTYTITNLKFWAGDQDVPLTGGGTPAPAKPLTTETPSAKATKYTVTLDATNTAGIGTASNQTAATITAASSGYDVSFSADNQWLVVTLPPTVVTALQDSKGANPSASFWIEINGTHEDGNNGNYRFYLGDATAQYNWNASAFGSNQYAFDGNNPADSQPWGIAGRILKQSYDGNTTNDSGHPAGSTVPSHFILRYSAGSASKVNIVSIDLYVLPPAQPAVNVFAGLQLADIGTSNANVTLVDGGYKVVTTAGYTWAFTYFKVTLPAGKTLADYLKVSYTIKGITVTPALSDGGGYKGASVYAFDTLEDIEGVDDGAGNITGGLLGLELSASSIDAYKIITTGWSNSGIGDMDKDNDKDAELLTTADSTSNEFYIVFQCGGSEGYTYELKNFKIY